MGFKFTYTWEIKLDDFISLQFAESPIFSTEYRKKIFQWRLQMAVFKDCVDSREIDYYIHYVELALESLTSYNNIEVDALLNTVVHSEISTISNNSVDPIKIGSVDLLQDVLTKNENWPEKNTFHDKLLRFSEVDNIRRCHLENGTLIIECKIHFIENIIGGYSDLSEAVQGILSPDRRLKEFDDFERILEDTKFSDVKILVDDKLFHVHKIILASRSSVFAAMLEHNVKESIESEIKIDDISYDVMKEMLRFIYVGKVNNIKDLACDLFVAADKYNLQGLKGMCEEVLINELSIENICDILGLVDHYKTSGLQSAAIQFVRLNSEELTFSREFNSRMSSLSENLYESLKNMKFEI